MNEETDLPWELREAFLKEVIFELKPDEGTDINWEREN